MSKRTQMLLILLCLGATVAWATTIRVPADQTTIQAGINAATNGDTVLVSPGTYYENVIFRGKKIVLTSTYVETHDLSTIKGTIINGSLPVHADTASCVLFMNGEDSTAVLQGFTLTGGLGTVWNDEHGAGKFREGGGILVALCAPTIRDNLIIGNTVAKASGVVSAGGGGIRAGDGNPTIINNVIAQNTGRYGAGVVLNFCGTQMRNNIICGNMGGTDYGGGALWINGNNVKKKVIQNNTIVANPMTGVYVYAGAATFKNCIIWRAPGVSAVQIGGLADQQTVSYSDVQGGIDGVANINSDPLFADSSYVLSALSPCVDSGDTSVAARDLAMVAHPDSALWPSRGGLRNDMGAFGGPETIVLPDYRVPTSVESGSMGVVKEMRLEQNWPNPFNPSTSISYSIASSKVQGDLGKGGMGPARPNDGRSGGDWVRLSVFDLLGREVAVLVEGYQMPGEHRVVFTGKDLASGVYLYRLTAGGQALTRRLVLLK